MEDSTLTAVQRLKDPEFHALCDEVIPRIYPRCFPITPHGRNERGDSVRGQPDSYVGDSARQCSIAIQYTVQATSWWAKVIQDVKDARDASPDAKEIFVGLPRDIDREAPRKLPGLNWFTDAQTAAAPAKLTIISGRTISHELDTTSQDLRWTYLGIPCSRVNIETLAASCKEATTKTVARLEHLDRYVSKRYVVRDADRRLFAFWQDCLRHVNSLPSSREKRIYIPLVADSGLGKTSLLAHFAQQSSLQAPVVLLLARDLLLNDEFSLVRAVLDRLQGSINGDARLQEEAALAARFSGRTPLTVVVDGLDETGNASALQRVISGWLTSKLGRSSVLITSSRKEFWRICRDATWQLFVYSETEAMRAPKLLRVEEPISSLDPLRGIELPGLFDSGELAAAWENAGRQANELWMLPSMVRESLRHPFAAKSAMELLSEGTSASELSSRATILKLWLWRRLQQEADSGARITAEHLHNALNVIARESNEADGGWIKVDQLDSAPRFDRQRPPGPVVERLITCGLLETRPQDSDQIRFTTEAVLDYYRAELMIEKIKSDPTQAASEIAEMTFSRSVSILEPIGEHLVNTYFANTFLTNLAGIDSAMAAVCMRPGLSSYPSDCRRCVVNGLGHMQRSQMEADRGLAIELLGRMPCSESREAILSYWISEKPTPRLRTVVAHAAISLGIPELVGEIFQAWWLKRDGYFIDLGPELAASSDDLRMELSNLASVHLDQPESEDYRRAIMLCGYLLDAQAIKAIERRTQNEHPYFYESLCLLRLGSAEALDLYKKLVDRYLHLKGDAEISNDEYNRWSCVFPFPEHIGRKPTNELVDYSIELIRSSNKDRQRAGCSLAGILYDPKLFAEMVRQGLFSSFAYSNYRGVGQVIGADRWLELWTTIESVDGHKSLLSIAADLRDTRVEDMVIVALQKKQLCNQAAIALMRMGSTRACPHLRSLLTDTSYYSKEDSWKIGSVVQALIALRDAASIDPIIKYMRSDVPDGNTKFLAANQIATIGTHTAEEAVLSIDWTSDEEHVAALICLGSRRCVETAVAFAKQSNRGVKWLLNSARHCFMAGGSSSNRLRSDVEIDPVLDYVKTQNTDSETIELLESLLGNLNSPEVSDQYAQWWSLRGTENDIKLKSPKDVMLSDRAKHELAKRGDIRVLRAHLNEKVDECTKYRMADLVSERLGVFAKSEVLATLRSMLSTEADEKRMVAIADILGRVGEKSDAVELRKIASLVTNTEVANVAYEAALRISDPLRLAQHW